MLVITYDEHGGFYDHVSPPTTTDEREEFQQLGFRVPSIVVGPTARRGKIIGTKLEHVSILKTLTMRFELPALNARVSDANDLSPCIDPAYLNNPQPAPVMPPVTMSKSAVRARRVAPAHEELAAALDRMQLPPSLDRRHRSAEVTEKFLENAARVGAVRLID